MGKNLDPDKHPFSAALYNTPKANHEWGGDGSGGYVGKHRKKGCLTSIALVAVATAAWYVYMELPVIFG
jgi:hypothetical protein